METVKIIPLARGGMAAGGGHQGAQAPMLAVMEDGGGKRYPEPWH